MKKLITFIITSIVHRNYQSFYALAGSSDETLTGTGENSVPNQIDLGLLLVVIIHLSIL